MHSFMVIKTISVRCCRHSEQSRPHGDKSHITTNSAQQVTQNKQQITNTGNTPWTLKY